MTWSLRPHPGGTTILIYLFCFFWPLAVAGFLRWRTSSPAPVAAMLLPVAIAELGVWNGLLGTYRGMAISGRGIASAAAGVAEAFSVPSVALFAVFFIGIAALVKRHRQVIDHVTAAIAVAVIVEMIAPLVFAARFSPTHSQKIVLLAWMWATALTVTGIAVWLVIVASSPAERRPLPFALPLVGLAYALLGAAVYREMGRYLRIAMTGVP